MTVVYFKSLKWISWDEVANTVPKGLSLANACTWLETNTAEGKGQEASAAR